MAETDIGTPDGVEFSRLSNREKARIRMREYARRKRKELCLVHDRMLQLYKELVRLGAYQDLSDESREFFGVYVNRERMAARSYPPNMYKMFGDDIAPGVSCTLREAMQRLYKGKNEINFMVKRWIAKHGVNISFEPSESGFWLDGSYVIKGIDPPARAGKVSDVMEIMSVTEQRQFREYEAGV